MADTTLKPVLISPATAADVLNVSDLCLRVERQHEEYSPLRWSLRSDVSEKYPQWLSRVISDPQWLVLCAQVPQTDGSDALFAGTLVANLMNEIPIYVCQRYAFIHEIAVLPEFRRRGIAAALLKEARHWAGRQGVSQVRLIAADRNPAAQALFASVGYQVTYREMIQPTAF